MCKLRIQRKVTDFCMDLPGLRVLHTNARSGGLIEMHCHKIENDTFSNKVSALKLDLQNMNCLLIFVVVQ